MTPPPISLAEAARRALAVIDERGWAQRCQLSDDGRVCASGAVAQACAGHPHDMVDPRYAPLTERLSAVAVELFPDRANRLIVYGSSYAALPAIVCVNDHHDTTVEDVRVIFEKTAIYFEENGQ